MKLVIGYWLADYSENQLTHIKTNKLVRLEPRAIEVLYYFAKKPNSVISQDELLVNIWKGRSVSSHAIYRVINLIRKNLDATDRNAYLKTISKKGYKLVQPVNEYTGGIPVDGYKDLTGMPEMASI